MSSLNLVDMVRGQMTGEFANRLSLLLGESRDRAQIGIDSAVPGILAAFSNTASTPDGATRLASAVDDADEGILSSSGAVLGRSTDWGTSSLQSIIGMGGLSELAGNIGRMSGLSGKAVTTLLGVVAPIALGVLKRLKRSRGLDAAGLSSYLAGQRDYIQEAMPADLRIGEFGGREPIRPVSRARESEYGEPARRTSSTSWVLPLALLALLLGGVWYLATRPTVRAGRDENRVAEETERRKQEMNARRTGQMASLEALQTKYGSAIQEARKQGVEISSMTEQDGKLVVRGSAPSAEAFNKVEEHFRRINPSMDDVILDLSVQSVQVTPSPSTEVITKETGKGSKEGVSRAKPTTESSGESGVQTYTVKRGDTLGTISKQFYGNTKGYKRIFNENRSQLKNPNSIEVGQELKIPAK